VPARLLRDAESLAEKLTQRPASCHRAAAGVEREAGYALLGALCLALPPERLRERRGALPALWAPALGAKAAAALDLTKYAPPGGPGQADGEGLMAAEAWWRASALAALQAQPQSYHPYPYFLLYHVLATGNQGNAVHLAGQNVM